ncbi:MAG: hypothetical protein IIB38_13755 [Candidatus Hydrogenedentes bacterium]|nr:hypothetical protein [Candidatus Hydrogenedentota bacterium]
MARRPSPNANRSTFDDSLLTLAAQACGWFEELTSGNAKSVREIAARYGIDEGDVE